jgi:hypothetical protein
MSTTNNESCMQGQATRQNSGATVASVSASIDPYLGPVERGPSLRHIKLAERPPRRRPSGGWTALEPRPNKHWRILQKEYPEGGDPGGARGFEQDRLDPRKEPSGDAQ